MLSALLAAFQRLAHLLYTLVASGVPSSSKARPRSMAVDPAASPPPDVDPAASSPPPAVAMGSAPPPDVEPAFFPHKPFIFKAGMAPAEAPPEWTFSEKPASSWAVDYVFGIEGLVDIVTGHVEDGDLLAYAMACTAFRGGQQRSGRALRDLRTRESKTCRLCPINPLDQAYYGVMLRCSGCAHVYCGTHAGNTSVCGVGVCWEKGPRCAECAAVETRPCTVCNLRGCAAICCTDECECCESPICLDCKSKAGARGVICCPAPGCETLFCDTCAEEGDEETETFSCTVCDESGFCHDCVNCFCHECSEGVCNTCVDTAAVWQCGGCGEVVCDPCADEHEEELERCCAVCGDDDICVFCSAGKCSSCDDDICGECVARQVLWGKGVVKCADCVEERECDCAFCMASREREPRRTKVLTLVLTLD